MNTRQMDLQEAIDAPTFDGVTYDHALDGSRLTRQLAKVAAFMADGRPHTLAELAEAAECSEASASARVRDLRKARFGGHVVERKRVGTGLWSYRLVA
jgi:hypothetical protein